MKTLVGSTGLPCWRCRSPTRSLCRIRATPATPNGYSERYLNRIGFTPRVTLLHPDILSLQHARRFWALASFSLRAGARVPSYAPLPGSPKPCQYADLRALLKRLGMRPALGEPDASTQHVILRLLAENGVRYGRTTGDGAAGNRSNDVRCPVMR